MSPANYPRDESPCMIVRMTDRKLAGSCPELLISSSPSKLRNGNQVPVVSSGAGTCQRRNFSTLSYVRVSTLSYVGVCSIRDPGQGPEHKEGRAEGHPAIENLAYKTSE
jgi:hypothetical protein